MNAPASKQTGNARLWLARLVLLLPAIVIAFAAVPRLVSGLAREVAFPATAYMEMNIALTTDYYAAVAQILSHAPRSDADVQLLRAEAIIRAGQSPNDAAQIAQAALSHSPASARGWIVLADALRQSDPQKAAAAIVLSAELGPREYFLTAPRATAGAPLWRYLPQRTRGTLLEDTSRLINIPALHPGLLALLRADGGPALVTRALAGHPDELRALNRSLARERMGMH